jgi:glycosyltransferase involved in cell wall biosynthesis
VTASSAWGAPARKVQYYRAIESRAVRGAKFVTAVSKHARDYISKSYGKLEDEIFVAPNGTQPQEDKAHFERPFKIIYLGGLESIYSPFDFVRTAEILRDTRYKFYILGDGSLRNEMIDYINRNSLDVTYLGFKDREKVLQILCQMQAGIYTVRDHIANRIASPLKVLDYTACGLPVISPRINETSSLVQKYDCGIVVERNEPNEFVNAIKELDNKDTWERKSLNAKEMIKKELTWEHTLQPLLTIYKDLPR